MSVLVTPLLPDELVWSLGARIITKFPCLDSKGLPEVFGRAPLTASKGFPAKLSNIAAAMNFKNAPNAREIARRHTFFPFAAPLLDSSSAAILLASMVDGNRALRAPAFLQPSAADHTLRLCAACIDEDIKRWGVPYCHRLHQLPFLRLCHKHKSPLFMTNISWRADFTPLPQSVEKMASLRYGSKDVQSRVAQDCEDLAQFTEKPPVRSELFTALGDALLSAGITTGARRDSHQLADKLERKFGFETLEEFGLRNHAATHRCALAILRNSARVPEWLGVHHVALLSALAGLTLLELLKKADGSRRDSGPWPCKAVGTHCSETMTIERWTRSSNNKARASFCCPECGTTYVRPLPLRAGANGLFEHHITRTRAAPPWTHQLRALWFDESHSWVSLSAALGQSQQKMGRFAAILNLPDVGSRKLGPFRIRAAKVKTWEAIRQEKRDLLSGLMRRNPSARCWNSTPSDAALLLWFQKFDPKHLRSVQGVGQPRLASVKYKLRKLRDEGCAAVVCHHRAEVMVKLSAVTSKITLKSLIAEFRRYPGFDLIRSLKRFPLTSAALRELAESDESHFERVFALMEKSLTPTNRPLRRIVLLRRYGITHGHYRREEFARRINDLYYGRCKAPGSPRGRNFAICAQNETR